MLRGARGWTLLVCLAVATIATACGDSGDAGTAGRGTGSAPGSTASSTTTGSTAEPVVRTVEEAVEFASPTGNIHCLIDPEAGYAECGAAETDWSAPPKPADCSLDWGQTMSVGTSGEPADFVCRGDVPFGESEPPPLAYGETMRAKDIECTSAEPGVTCTATGSGRGFTISRATYRFF